MIAVNDNQINEKIASYMNEVTENKETVVIVRENRENIVMLSEESYNNLLENAYLMESKANYDWLMESKAQLEAGKILTHTLTEVDADE